MGPGRWDSEPEWECAGRGAAPGCQTYSEIVFVVGCSAACDEEGEELQWADDDAPLTTVCGVEDMIYHE